MTSPGSSNAPAMPTHGWTAIDRSSTLTSTTRRSSFSAAKAPDEDPGHEQVEAISPDGDTMGVDAGLVGLLSEIWRRGWGTRASCEAHTRGDTQVVFGDHEHALAFVQAVFGEPATAPVRMHTWFVPWPQVGRYASVYFPNTLLPSAEERLRKGGS